MSENWELIDYDPHTMTKTWMGYDEGTDSVLVSHEQDKRMVQAILDRNKAGQNEQHGRMGDMEKVASIPNEVLFEWLSKFGVHPYKPEHAEARKRLLNSSDYRYLRCREIIL